MQEDAVSLTTNSSIRISGVFDRKNRSFQIGAARNSYDLCGVLVIQSADAPDETLDKPSEKFYTIGNR
ncbi:hypothetical protein ACFQDM_07655 [Ponticaulis profundi]|uniref:Uncharacterized protein n=1 Tax=Ponticaulis profundi TaxID=2665222 RepID=A0ABW1S9L6_9PROT